MFWENVSVILPPLNTLQAFEAAARHSSLSKAGEELHITHAAVSGQIKRLESWFGCKLFERVGRGVTLTPAGQEFWKTVSVALGSVSNTSQRLRKRRDRKHLSIACIPSIATRWLVPNLSDFSSRYPSISIQVSYAEALEDFDAENYDILITHQHITTDKWHSVKLFSRVNRPVASPIYLKQHQIDSNLSGARLLHDERLSAWEEWFDKAGKKMENITHGPVYQDFNLLATAVIAGHGVALCPVEVFRREILDGDLVELSDISTLDSDGYYIVSENNGNPWVETFSEWFVDKCSSIRADQEN